MTLQLMRLTLRQLQIFSAIARTGTTTAAAEQISLSQSAVSAAVKELEQSLGLELFDRVGKRLLLNDHGRAILPQAMDLLSSAESLEMLCHSNAPCLLRIGASLTIGNYLLPGLLADFLREQGFDIHEDTPPLKVIVASTADIAQQVENYDVDIGLVEGLCTRQAIRSQIWLEDELVIVAAPDHPVVKHYGNNSIPLDRLAQANWLLRETGSGTREALEQMLLHKLGHIKSTLEFNDHESIKHAAMAGLGLACLSRWAVKDRLAIGHLLELNTDMGRLRRQFSILLQQNKRVTPGMQKFLTFLQRRPQPV
jgi:DNA-binding transcriptional LysR family regulator